MFRSLWAKFFILLLVVSAIALSAAIYLRGMMVHDFQEFLEGERLDRIYLVTAGIEGSYEQAQGWDKTQLSEHVIWALMLDMVVQVEDKDGNKVLDTEQAVEGLTPLMRRRVLSPAAVENLTDKGEFIPYPLFLGGKQIGVLKTRFFVMDRSRIFIERSNRFLLIAFIMMGGLAVLASLLVSRRLTRPIKELVSQTEAIRAGELGRRAAISSSDEIGRLSSSFNKMADDLELQESLKRKLIANVAHELRTPLAAMRGELEGMADGVLPTSNEQIRSLLEETERLRAILDGIDDLTKAQASSLDLRIEKINLKSFLGNIRDRFEGQFREKGIALDVEVKEDDSVMVDPDSLSQIIINLLSNALRATPQGGIVTMRAGVSGRDAFLEVEDTGEGIGEEDLPFIFERFYRVKEEGLGLGLTIVKELVDAHGGHITIHSKEGEGTLFRVTLPGEVSS